jgi:hypothetical protein
VCKVLSNTEPVHKSFFTSVFRLPQCFFISPFPPIRRKHRLGHAPLLWPRLLLVEKSVRTYEMKSLNSFPLSMKLLKKQKNNQKIILDLCSKLVHQALLNLKITQIIFFSPKILHNGLTYFIIGIGISHK